MALFVEAQRTALIQATEAAYDVSPLSSAQEAIAAVRDRLLQRGRVPLKEWLAAKDIANNLVNAATQRFWQISQQLQQEIGGAAKGFSFASSGGQEQSPTPG